MSSDEDADSRYEEILRRIASRKQPPPQSIDPLVRILNGLNVIRMVDGRDHYFWTSACKAHDMAPGI